MSILTSATVLDLWEAGSSMTPAARAVLLLQATGENDLTEWPVGRRDQALLERFCTGASARETVADCPDCGAVLEVLFDPRELRDARWQDRVSIEMGDCAVSARPPTVGDLAALPVPSDAEELRRFLLTRCVLTAERGGRPVPVHDLPDDVVALVENALDEADPAADIRIALSCHECGTTWSETLDPVVLAWSAVERAARVLATEVHTLAQAYGWGEREILGLSLFRRHLYLTAVGP